MNLNEMENIELADDFTFLSNLFVKIKLFLQCERNEIGTEVYFRQ